VFGWEQESILKFYSIKLESDKNLDYHIYIEFPNFLDLTDFVGFSYIYFS